MSNGHCWLYPTTYVLVVGAQPFFSASLVPALSFYAGASLALSTILFLRFPSIGSTEADLCWWSNLSFSLHVGCHHVPDVLGKLDSIQLEKHPACHRSGNSRGFTPRSCRLLEYSAGFHFTPVHYQIF